MGNLFTSLYTGTSGIQTNQVGLNTVSHNLANVNTEGYVRQQVLQKDTYYNTIGTNHISSLQVGYGSGVEAIRQVRDVFLDKSYRLEVGRQEFYQAQSEAADEVESLFGEISGEAFSETISDFWTALQELAKEPDSIVKRAAVVSRAVTLIERGTSVSDALSLYQQNLNTNILNQVNRINEIGSQITDLNDKIVRYESSGQNANDLRDSRNALLDELSEMVKTSYEEDPTGRVSVSIEGRQFVTDSRVLELDVLPTEDGAGLLNVVWADGLNTPLYDLNKEYSSDNNSDIGSLKGLLVARGTSGVNYTSIPQREEYDTDAAYNTAVSDYNNTIGQSVVSSTQAQFDQLIHGIVTSINDVLCPNTELSDLADSLGITTDGTSDVTITVNGVEQKVDLSSSDLLVWDEYNAPITVDGDNKPGEELFSRTYTDRYTEATLSYVDEDGATQTKTVYVYNQEDADDIYSLYTLGQVQVNESVQKEVANLPLNGNAYQGDSDSYSMGICNQLTDLFNTKFSTISPTDITSYTFSDYYTAMTGNIAMMGNSFSTIADSQSQMVESIDNQRQSIMGVSSEEELTNMIKYQWGYSASTKYISAVNEMLDSLINMVG